MKKRTAIPLLAKIISHGCIYYTVVSLLLYLGGLLFSTIEREWIPTLDMLVLLLLFTLSVSAANQMVLLAGMPMLLKLLIHYAVTLTVFFVVFIWWGGFSDSGSAVLVLLLAYTLVYGIGALIFGAIRHIRANAVNRRTEYADQFRK